MHGLDLSTTALGNNASVPATEQAMQEKKFRLSVKLAAALVVVVAAGGLFEVAARLVYVYRDDIQSSPLISGILQRSLILDPYEMPSPRGGYHWVLRPGYRASMDQLVAEKKLAGRELGARVLQASIENWNPTGKAGFRINSDGYKGPELDRSHARPRILALGDSTTFGIGTSDYPRGLENALNGQGLPVEVINGGVEGYFPRNVLFEIERYRSLKPDIVTLYIGWNALYSRVPWTDAWENTLRLVWLLDRSGMVLKAIFGDRRTDAVKLFNRDLKPAPASPEVKALETYAPSFMDRIERIVDEFERIGTEVVLVTLPGLFVVAEKPSAKALKIGHLPYFTENPYVLAKLTERYNQALRALAVRRRLQIIDLEKWSAQALQPRDSYFADSVHLTARGLDMIGAFMAEQLADRIEKLPNTKER